MSFVDTAMVGRLGSAALAGVGIGNGLFFALTLVGLGCVLGMDPLVAQALGAGEHAAARRIYASGVRVALLVSAPVMAAMTAALLLLVPLGVEPAVARETTRFLLARLPNAVPFLLLAAARSHLQAASITRPILWATAIANVVNFAGNALLIYGDATLERFGLPGIGLPALGVVGSGISSTLAALVAWLVALRGVRELTREAGSAPAPRLGDAETARKIVRLGWPLGVQLLAEVGAFTIVSILAGRIGPEAAAGHQVALTLASLSFTVTLGLAAATSVRVGQAVGRDDTPGARRVGFLALGLAIAFMSLSAAVFTVAPHALARILTDRPDVLAAAVPLVRVAAFFQVFDGAQVVAAAALRGAGDTKSVRRANIVGHYVVGLPTAILLGLGLGLGATGLWWGLCAGLTAVGVGLSLRFHHLSKRRIERV